jgi:hypothetical protein
VYEIFSIFPMILLLLVNFSSSVLLAFALTVSVPSGPFGQDSRNTVRVRTVPPADTCFDFTHNNNVGVVAAHSRRLPLLNVYKKSLI